jgi:hypothetical protein
MGGVAKHMSHVYENMDMTFSNLVSLFDGVASGKIEVTEKVDGQNLYFTYDIDEGVPKFARNTDTHVAVGGYTREMLNQEFIRKGEGRPDYAGVIKTFNDGMKAIESAMSAIDPIILQKIFYRPGVWVNSEVMSGDNRNIVVYNGNFIVLHGIEIISDTFSPSDMTPEELRSSEIQARNAFSLLASAIDRKETEIASVNWQIVGPKLVQLQNFADGDFIERVENAIDGILDGTGLTFRNTFRDFVTYHLYQAVSRTFTFPPSDEVFGKILTLVLETQDEKRARTAVGNVINLRALKSLHPYPEDHEALRNLALSGNVKNILAIILEPFAQLTVQFSSEILTGATSYFMQDSDHAKTALTQMTALAIERIPAHINSLIQQGAIDPRAAKEAESIKLRFDKNLKRLRDVSTITTGIEGVVFEYPPMSNRYYKFTGGFAPANQLLGLLGWEEKAEIVASVSQ